MSDDEEVRVRALRVRALRVRASRGAAQSETPGLRTCSVRPGHIFGCGDDNAIFYENPSGLP